MKEIYFQSVPKTVSKLLRPEGHSGGRPSKRNRKELAVRALYNSGVTIAEIVRQTDLSRSTVNRIIKDIRADTEPTDKAFKEACTV